MRTTSITLCLVLASFGVSAKILAEPDLTGVRLENGNYPTLRLFFVQCGVDCA